MLSDVEKAPSPCMGKHYLEMESWLGSSQTPYRFQGVSPPPEIQDMNRYERENGGEGGGRKKGVGKERPSAGFKPKQTL